MKYIYIASPYTKGDVAENVRVSLLTATSLVHSGYIPFCPLLYHFWHYLGAQKYDFWMKLDIEWLRKCDAVLRLPGESAGADSEVAQAREWGMPVCFSVAELFDKVKP